MKKGSVAVLLIVLLSGVLSADHFLSLPKEARTQERDYPRPRYVVYDTKLSPEQLMYLARQQARQTETRNGRLGVIEPGKKGLLTLRRDQDMDVVHAVIKALRERGADADYIYTEDLLEKYGYPGEYATPPHEPDPITEGPLYLLVYGLEKYRLGKGHFSQAAWDILPQRGQALFDETRKRFNARNAALKKHLDSHPEYDYVFLDWFSGGPMLNDLSIMFGRKFQIGWRLPTKDKLIREGSIPRELWRALEMKVLEVIPWIRHVRVVDPEGTDISFPISSEDAGYWRTGAYLQDYIRLYPFQSGRWLYRSLGVKHVIVPDANGVIAGTIGQDGAVIPYMKLTVKKGLVVNVEGGGVQGFVLNDIREKFKDHAIPLLPGPGWAWVFQLSLSVNPKQGAAALDWAFGPEIYLPDIEEFGKKHDMPITHEFHFENRLPTYEATVTGGKTFRIVDRGHLAVLDDPEIRAIASKYGDPDDILREEGARPIPGINTPGDYWSYAKDPVPYWVQQRKERESGKSPYLDVIPALQLRTYATQ